VSLRVPRLVVCAEAQILVHPIGFGMTSPGFIFHAGSQMALNSRKPGATRGIHFGQQFGAGLARLHARRKAIRHGLTTRSGGSFHELTELGDAGGRLQIEIYAVMNASRGRSVRRVGRDS